MRKPILAANWKMNIGPKETEDFLAAFTSKLGQLAQKADIVIAPPFTSIPAAVSALEGTTSIQIAAQNVSDKDNGAFTGEVSTTMLRELFVHYVIIGHSERRTLYGECDGIINAKIKKARQANMKPIFCIGETLEERDNGQLESVLTRQITEGLRDIEPQDLKEITIAYEPVWAIGTGRTATAQQAQEAHAFVRSVIAGLYGQELADKVRIQYGGSMKPGNAAELIAQPDIDGGLIGGASLEPQSFIDLITAVTDSLEG